MRANQIVPAIAPVTEPVAGPVIRPVYWTGVIGPVAGLVTELVNGG